MLEPAISMGLRRHIADGESRSETAGSETIIFYVWYRFLTSLLFSSQSMARLPRYFMPGCPQHVILRGNNRQAILAAQFAAAAAVAEDGRGAMIVCEVMSAFSLPQHS